MPQSFITSPNTEILTEKSFTSAVSSKYANAIVIIKVITVLQTLCYTFSKIAYDNRNKISKY